MSAAILIVCCVGLVISMVWMSVRNEMVYSTRSYFNFLQGEKTFHLMFNLLPSYDQMMFHPKYWHLWTIPQWERHLKRLARRSS